MKSIKYHEDVTDDSLFGVIPTNFQNISGVKCKGGMQDNNKSDSSDTNEKDRKKAKEIKALARLFRDSSNEEELKQKIEYHNGNIELVIKGLIQQSVEKEVLHNISFYLIKAEHKSDELKEKTKQVIFKIQEQRNAVNEISGNNDKSVQKEIEKTEIGETNPGINLQGHCSNETCLASKAKLPVWVNIGFDNITFISDKTSFSCPDCKKETVNLI
ncbi:hypothetical protein RFI_29973, partial [Reticulomyxa filosa]